MARDRNSKGPKWLGTERHRDRNGETETQRPKCRVFLGYRKIPFKISIGYTGCIHQPFRLSITISV